MYLVPCRSCVVLVHYTCEGLAEPKPGTARRFAWQASDPHVRISATSRHAGFGTPLVQTILQASRSLTMPRLTQRFIGRVMCMAQRASTAACSGSHSILAERLPRRSAAIISRFRSSSQKERKKSGHGSSLEGFRSQAPPSILIDQTFCR